MRAHRLGIINPKVVAGAIQTRAAGNRHQRRNAGVTLPGSKWEYVAGETPTAFPQSVRDRPRATRSALIWNAAALGLIRYSRSVWLRIMASKPRGFAIATDSRNDWLLGQSR